MQQQQQQLIEVIAAALSDNATKEQKQSGVQACRTIITALDCEPGQPLVLPGAPRPHALAGVSIDQVLELAIARLSVLAKDQERAEPSASGIKSANPDKTPTAQQPAVTPGLRVPLAKLPSVPGNARTAPSRAQAAPATARAVRKPRAEALARMMPNVKQ